MWEVFNLIWDAKQQRSISRVSDKLQTANLSLESLRDRLLEAHERLDRSNLVNLAMWELIAERLGLTTEQLRQKVIEIDLRDGLQDGKFSGEAPACGGCGRKMNPNRSHCLNCGDPRPSLGLGDVLGG